MSRISFPQQPGSLAWIMAMSVLFGGYAPPALSEEGGVPRTFRYDLRLLNQTKQRYQAGDPSIQLAVNNLFAEATRYFNRRPSTVIEKKVTAPSGDIHDYFGFGAYLWPNPNTPDGLPWIFLDGQANPDAGVDLAAMGNASHSINFNALAYYLTDDELYAQRAAETARKFFLDPATHMNPNGRYGKVWPGVNDGGFAVAGFGGAFRIAMDGLGILEKSPHWTASDKQSMQTWIGELYQWMETTPWGQAEKNALNNHGTNYDMMAALFSLYNEDEATARSHVEHVAYQRIAQQIGADGRQVQEMGRANNLLYHEFNLATLLDIAEIGDKVGFDLWNYQTADGRGIELALDFFAPYATGDPWPYFPGTVYAPNFEFYVRLYRRAAVGFGSDSVLRMFSESFDQHFANIEQQIPGDFSRSLEKLTHPLATKRFVATIHNAPEPGLSWMALGVMAAGYRRSCRNRRTPAA